MNKQKFFSNFSAALESITVEFIEAVEIEIAGPAMPLESLAAPADVVAGQTSTARDSNAVSVPANKAKRKTRAQVIEECEPLECHSAIGENQIDLL